MTHLSTAESKRLNEWLKLHAKDYARNEVLAAIKRELGLTPTMAAVRQREHALGIDRSDNVGKHGFDLSPEERIAKRSAVKRAKEETSVYRKLYEQLQKDHEALRQEFELALDMGEYEATRIKITPTTGTGNSEATVMVLASDWHVEETVLPESVNMQNKYSLAIAKERAVLFFERTVKLVKKEQHDVTIKQMVMWLGGDFISGNIHDELMESCTLRPAEAILYAYDLLDSGIQYMLEQTDLDFVFVCSVGNHSRMTKKVHVATERGNSTEWMLYHFLAKRYKGNKRIKFVIEDSYHTYLKVYNYNVRFHHGHAIRFQGGIGGLHIPLNKAIAQWDKSIRADVDCMGHWHTYTPSRRYIVNGSLIGMNSFGIWIKADYEPPIQAMFLLDRDRGVTVQMPILVDKKRST